MPNFTKLTVARLGTPEFQTSRIDTPVTSTGTEIISNVPFEDDDGVVLDVPLKVAVKYISGNYAGYVENMTVTAIDSSKKVLTVVRGTKRTGSDYLTGSADLAKAIPKDSIIEIVDSVETNTMVAEVIEGERNIKAKHGTSPAWDTTQSNLAQTVPVYADNTARDASITTPVNGMVIYNTAEGLQQKYVGGAWVDDAGTTTPNATESVSGKVELATLAEQGAQTETGSSGAGLVLQAKNTAKTSSGAVANEAVLLNDNAKVDPSLCENVSDEVYGATWDNVTDEAPSKNAVYDKIESIPTANLGINTSGNYYKMQMPSDVSNWITSSCTMSYEYLALRIQSSNAFSANSYISDFVGSIAFSSNKEIELDILLSIPTHTDDISWGMSNRLFYSTNTSGGYHAMFTWDDSANILYARTANGSTQTLTDVTSGITVSNKNSYKIKYSHESVEFYINGNLVATHTNNVPTGGQPIDIGVGGASSGQVIYMMPPVINLEI